MEHLSLSWRKVLNARIGVLKATSRRWADARIQDPDISNEFGLLESHLLVRASQLFKGSSDEETLAVALAKISHNLDVDSVTGINHSLLDQVVQDLSTELAQVVCPNCATHPACVADPRIVDQNGICIGFFRECMELARAEAIAWYQKFLPGGLQAAPLIEFSTLPVVKPPDSISVAKHICGKTLFADTPDFRSEIQLLIHVSELDLDSYYAAAYIIFHEMICHAFQGLRKASRNRERRTREIDSFGEGWMDWVAFRVFADVVAECGWSDIHSTLDGEARAIVNRYRDARLGRFGNTRQERTRAFFQIGEEAAQEYHAFLNAQPGWSAADAENAFFRISFDWNLEGDCPKRREFVKFVRQVLRFDRSSESISGLTESLEKYRKSGKVLDLVGFD